MPALESLHPALNLLLLSAAALFVWVSGARLARYAEGISNVTGLGQAFVGTLFLGGATSLPEIATSITASLLGDADMAANNLLGGIVMQTAVLAFVDALFVKGALTFFAPSSALMLSGVLLCAQIAVAITAIAAGDVVLVFGVGAWTPVLFALYVASVVFLQRYEGAEAWAVASDEFRASREDLEPETVFEEAPNPPRLYGYFALAATGVLIGGWAVSTLAHTIAQQTGIASGFLGATAVAIATSLPEVSATMAAVKRHAFVLAVSNIFGSNALMVALFLVVDVGYRDGAVIDGVGSGTILMGGLGIVVTALYLWGLLERRDRTVLNMGVDSALVVVTYLIGLVLLYFHTHAA